MNGYEREAKGGMRLQAPVGDRQIISELNEDFSLPDYQPEIKRLLRIKATVSPADKYIGAGSAECSGSIDYSILYSGNDGALYCTNQTGEYRFVCPVELPQDFEIGEGILCDVDTQPELTAGRVAGPRKLSVKCRLKSRVKLYGCRVIGERLGDRAGLQRLHGEGECARIFLGEGESLTLGDEILCESRDGQIRVISAEGTVFVTEATAGSGNVNCRGELCLKLLCCDEESAEPALPYVMLRRIPFSQQIDVDGVEINCDCCASGTCTDLHITVEEGKILCEATLRLQARAQRNERAAYTRDLYSTAEPCEAERITVTLPRALRCFNGNLSVNAAIPLSEAGIHAGARLVDLCGSASVSLPEADRGKYYLSGKCKFLAILSENGELSAQELELPFRYELDGSAELPTDADLCAEVITCRAKLDGERIGVDAELALSGAIRTQCELQPISDARFEGTFAPVEAAYTVCYPAHEDTLWSIARRYHCSVSELSTRNSLASAPSADSAESLAGVTFLLV